LYTPQASGTNAPVERHWSVADLPNAPQQHYKQVNAPQQGPPQVQQFQPVQQQLQPAQQQFQPSQQLLQPSQQQGTQAAPQQAQPMTPTVSAAAAGGYAKVGSGNGGWQQPNTWGDNSTDQTSNQWNNEQEYNSPGAASSNQWANAKTQSGNNWKLAAAADHEEDDDGYESFSQPERLSTWQFRSKGHKGKGKGNGKYSTGGKGHSKG
jgi:hypothetical protein